MSNADLIKRLRGAAGNMHSDLMSRHAQMLFAAADALEAHEWRTDMENAPRDGTEICLGVVLDWHNDAKDGRDPRVGNGFYVLGGYWFDEDAKRWRNRIGMHVETPDAWKPLYTPPDTQNT